MSEPNELKPCPFCGHPAEYIEFYRPGKVDFIQCANPDCLIQVRTDNNCVHQVIAMENTWNERPIEDALRVERDDLLRQMNDYVVSTTDRIVQINSRAERAEALVNQLGEALLAQRWYLRTVELCWCVPGDYNDLVEQYGSDRVGHSEYCQQARAAYGAWKGTECPS